MTYEVLRMMPWVFLKDQYASLETAMEAIKKRGL
jgi:hypothetical protein